MHGRTLGEMQIGSDIGAAVVAILSGAEFQPNPSADYHFQAGDMVGVMGNQEELERFAGLAGASSDRG